MSELKKPNLFSYAKKELSQDAMICWLIKWADQQFAEVDPELHACGRTFVGALLGKHQQPLPERIETTIHQQDRSIDVLAALGDNHVLLIEDKTGTKNHSDQLRRYYREVIEGRTKLKAVGAETVYPIYLKTGNQSRRKDREIEAVGGEFHRRYRVFNRGDFLEVLDTYKDNHHALRDFRDYLNRWECSTNSFQNWEKANRAHWSWASWEGFYRYLESQLDVNQWEYVANRSGGFQGLWWKFIRVEGNGGPQIYLQLEADPRKDRYLLCFKVCDTPKARRRQLKKRWHRRIRAAGGGRVEGPRVMRVGASMTVGLWEGEWLAFRSGVIDLQGTVENLKDAEAILHRAARLGN